MSELNGVLVVDKPAGWTSFDVLAKLRGVLHTRCVWAPAAGRWACRPITTRSTSR